MRKHKYVDRKALVKNQSPAAPRDAFSLDAQAVGTTLSSRPLGLTTNAYIFRPAPESAASFGANSTKNRGHNNTDAGRQKYPRAGKNVPTEFMPLVKVLEQKLAKGVLEVESSSLGQLLSQEATQLSHIYHSAGVTQLKDYVAVATRHGIITARPKDGDGHSYVALSTALRRNKTGPA